MFRKKLFIPVVALAFAATASGQIGQRAASSLPATATTNCQSTFTAGKDDSFLQFCVTANGNVTEFQSPQGVEHIREGGYIEGYAICTTDTLHNVGYFDLADLGDSGNWHDPVITQPNGPNTFPLKIARTTSDENFTLTQTFSRNAGERTAKITMSVTNHTSVPRNLWLYRYVDLDANNGHGGDFKNEFDLDLNSIWAYNIGVYGLTLAIVPSAKPQANQTTTKVLNNPAGFSPCNNANGVTTPFFGDGSALIGFEFQLLKTNRTKTVSVEYQPL